jgi:hypothetical protein
MYTIILLPFFILHVNSLLSSLLSLSLCGTICYLAAAKMAFSSDFVFSDPLECSSSAFIAQDIESLTPSQSVSNTGSTASTVTHLFGHPGRLKCAIFPRPSDETPQLQLEQDFYNWWRQTIFGIKEPKFKWNNTGRQSDKWDYFHEVAVVSTGEPRLCCKHCSRILLHPEVKVPDKRRQGTKTLRDHIESKKCGLISSARSSNYSQPSIRDGFLAQVIILDILFSITTSYKLSQIGHLLIYPFLKTISSTNWYDLSLDVDYHFIW